MLTKTTSSPALSSHTPSSTIPIKVEFSGGLEILFSGQRSCKIQLPEPPTSTPPTIASLIEHLISVPFFDSSRKDLFVMDGTVRPGILVLINDADWELEGEGACELKAGDEVVFVSTLHGG